MAMVTLRIIPFGTASRGAEAAARTGLAPASVNRTGERAAAPHTIPRPSGSTERFGARDAAPSVMSLPPTAPQLFGRGCTAAQAACRQEGAGTGKDCVDRADEAGVTMGSREPCTSRAAETRANCSASRWPRLTRRSSRRVEGPAEFRRADHASRPRAAGSAVSNRAIGGPAHRRECTAQALSRLILPQLFETPGRRLALRAGGSRARKVPRRELAGAGRRDCCPSARAAASCGACQDDLGSAEGDATSRSRWKPGTLFQRGHPLTPAKLRSGNRANEPGGSSEHFGAHALRCDEAEAVRADGRIGTMRSAARGATGARTAANEAQSVDHGRPLPRGQGRSRPTAGNAPGHLAREGRQILDSRSSDRAGAWPLCTGARVHAGIGPGHLFAAGRP